MKKITFSIFTIVCFLSSFAQKQVDTITVFSGAMKNSMKTVVVKPANYFGNTQKFNVVYLLHGYSGAYNNWIKKMPSLPQMATEFNCIIVCPDGGYSSWYVDSKTDATSKYETFVSKELIEAIDARYSTIKSNEGRAITGLSMGGHGALMLAFKHQDVFGAAASMSGAVDLSGLKYGIDKIIGDTIEVMKVSVLQMADTFSNKKMPLLIDCGIKDQFINANRMLHGKLMNRNIDHTYIERDGGHSWDYWINALPYHLLFFRNYFSKMLKK